MLAQISRRTCFRVSLQDMLRKESVRLALINCSAVIFCLALFTRCKSAHGRRIVPSPLSAPLIMSPLLSTPMPYNCCIPSWQRDSFRVLVGAAVSHHYRLICTQFCRLIDQFLVRGEKNARRFFSDAPDDVIKLLCFVLHQSKAKRWSCFMIKDQLSS